MLFNILRIFPLPNEEIFTTCIPKILHYHFCDDSYLFCTKYPFWRFFIFMYNPFFLWCSILVIWSSKNPRLTNRDQIFSFAMISLFRNKIYHLLSIFLLNVIISFIKMYFLSYRLIPPYTTDKDYHTHRIKINPNETCFTFK